MRSFTLKHGDLVRVILTDKQLESPVCFFLSFLSSFFIRQHPFYFFSQVVRLYLFFAPFSGLLKHVHESIELIDVFLVDAEFFR